MCGRFTLATPAARLMDLFRLQSFPEIQPRLNIAPTQRIVCVRQVDQLREAVELRWGLVPSWAKDLTIGNRMINARSETAAEKPSFRKAWADRRCLIPADGFYEWQKVSGGKKQPWMIHLPDREPFAFAGLWESWKPKDAADGDSIIQTCTILTTAANNDLQHLHERMPVFVQPERFDLWLSPNASPGQLQQLMQPLPEGRLELTKASMEINKVSRSSDHSDPPTQKELFS